MSASATKTTAAPRRLTAQDAFFLYGESRNAPMHIGALGMFEGKIDFARMTDRVERMLQLSPVYRQRLRFAPFNLAHPALEDDPAFAIGRHLHRHAMPHGSGDADLSTAAMSAFEQPLDRRHPLWEFHLFTGPSGDRSALLAKVHHCIADGLSGMELLKGAMDRRAEAVSVGRQRWIPTLPASGAEAFLDAIFDGAEARVAAAQRTALQYFQAFDDSSARAKLNETAADVMLSLARPAVPMPWNDGAISRSRAMRWTRFSVAQLRAIRVAFAATLNDVLLTVLAEAAARYLRHHRIAAYGIPMRIACPVSVRRRSQWGTLGNQVSMMFPESEAVPMNPAVRLASIAASTRRIKAAKQPEALHLMMSAGDVIPSSVAASISAGLASAIDGAARIAALAPIPANLRGSGGISFLFTNVPGPRTPLYFAGHRMTDSIGLLPLTTGMGYGVVAITYDRNVYLGMIADPVLMPDLEVMRSFTADAMRELTDTAAKMRGARPSADRAAA